MNKRTGARKIDERDLPQHLRFGKKGRSAAGRPLDEPPTEKRVCGEEIKQGNAVTLRSDGEVYQSDLEEPATHFSLEGGSEGDMIELTKSEPVEVEDSDLVAGCDVWLANPGGSGVNVTTDYQEYEEDYYIQHLGRAVTGSMLIPEIGEPYLVKI